MTKRKEKKRFVLGKGYPWRSGMRNVTLYESADVNIATKALLSWPGRRLGHSKYRLVLEEV